MIHSSVPMNTPCEFINITPLNPLISHCEIKVCYIGENRNKTVITKEVAKEMANSLPGNPIVGFYNEAIEDFEEHTRDLRISNGKITLKDVTRPYGFVDLNAKCWFKKFMDDGVNEREYLMTEGYLWTGQYPECQRIIDKGNNQSMELNKKTLEGEWTKSYNNKPEFFIINRAIIEKLCILGDECEPCFEGSRITSFSFNKESFKEALYSMEQQLTELKELINSNKEGGTQMFTTYAVTVGDSLWNSLYDHVQENYSIAGIFEDDNQKYAVLQSRENTEQFSRLNFSYSQEEGFSPAEEISEIEYSLTDSQFDVSEVEAFEANYKKKSDEEKEDTKKEEAKEEEPKAKEESSEGSEGEEDKGQEPEKEKAEGEEKEEKNPKKEDKEDKDKKKKSQYSLEEIPEYVDLLSKFSNLEEKYNALKIEKENLESQNEALNKFKLEVDRAAKEEMVKNFYMLSDEDKKEVVNNLDKYSLEEVEAKLSVICYRNKVDFNLDNKEDEGRAPYSYNLGVELDDSTTPAWIKAAIEVADSMN